jgi:hypothetical protein
MGPWIGTVCTGTLLLLLLLLLQHQHQHQHQHLHQHPLQQQVAWFEGVSNNYESDMRSCMGGQHNQPTHNPVQEAGNCVALTLVSSYTVCTVHCGHPLDCVNPSIVCW